MILKALYDYYNRAEGLAPEGLEYKEIGFVIVLDRDGRFLRLEDRRIDKKRCSTYLVPKALGRTSALAANSLWDNSEYVLGYSDNHVTVEEISKKPENERTDKEIKKLRESQEALPKSIKKLQTFREKVIDLYEKYPNEKELSAVFRFYQQDDLTLLASVQQDALWESIRKDLTKNFSFQIQGEMSLVAERVAQLLVSETKTNTSNEETPEGVCLVTGEPCIPVDITYATPIPNSKSIAKLVAFQVSSGYDSYGKTQCANAPISPKASFAYATALNHLLAKGSKNKFYLSSQTYVFWASSRSEAAVEMEQSIFALLGRSDETADDPNQGILQVRDTFMKVYSGLKPSTSDDRFYILGLAPNSARIAVVYWQELPLKEFAHHLLQHFEDMEVVDTRPEDKRKPYTGLHTILSAVTLGGKSSDATPNLADAVVKSIMTGGPYPTTLYQACLRRIRAEQKADSVRPYWDLCRIGILKAFLNRYTRITNNANKPLEIMLDTENTNVGYLCGRLFATLEYAQSRANNMSTIRERYMNAAGTTPAAVFPTLLNLNVHHVEKLDAGTKTFLERLKGEILEKVSASGLPAHLDLSDQGRFFVGYYHQRQAFYTKKDVDATE